MIRRPPRSTLFPSPPLSRSREMILHPWRARMKPGARPPHALQWKSAEEAAAMAISSLTRQLLRTLRSEEHTSELQSRQYLVCRLLLEKKKKTKYPPNSIALE